MKKYNFIFHTLELAENTCNKLKLYAAYLHE